MEDRGFLHRRLSGQTQMRMHSSPKRKQISFNQWGMQCNFFSFFSLVPCLSRRTVFGRSVIPTLSGDLADWWSSSITLSWHSDTRIHVQTTWRICHCFTKPCFFITELQHGFSHTCLRDLSCALSSTWTFPVPPYVGSNLKPRGFGGQVHVLAALDCQAWTSFKSFRRLLLSDNVKTHQATEEAFTINFYRGGSRGEWIVWHSRYTKKI